MLDKNSETRYEIKKIHSLLMKKTLGEEIKDLFISYSWTNKTEVHELCLELEKKGYKLWLDKNDMKYGILHEIMQTGIDQSKYFVCCASTAYCKKDCHGNDGNALKEFRYAAASKKKIIFVLFETYDNDEEMKQKLHPIGFDLLPSLYFKPDNTIGIIKAIEHLNNLNDPKILIDQEKNLQLSKG